MKPDKRCDKCGKPIWDHDYVSIRDPYMDADVHIHSQCYEKERLEQIEYEVNMAMLHLESDCSR